MLTILAIPLILLSFTHTSHGAKTCPVGKHPKPRPKPTASTPGKAPILTASAPPAATSTPNVHTCPGGEKTANPTCCAFIPLRDDLQKNLFKNTCDEEVHEVLRLSFHDAAGFSISRLFPGNGADGSLLSFPIESTYGANTGLSDPIDDLTPFLKSHNISSGDLIQFAAATGLTNCPGAPRLQFLAGRPPPSIPSADGSLPEPQQSVSQILSRTLDMGLTSNDMINLLASHSIAKADHVYPSHSSVPLDSTPGIFDSQFYLETLLQGNDNLPFNASVVGAVSTPLAKDGIMRLESDYALAHDPRTACQWQSFVGNQELMMSAFAESMAKMALIGQDASKLVDCSDVIPAATPLSSPSCSYPSGLGKKDVVQSCRFPFPSVSK